MSEPRSIPDFNDPARAEECKQKYRSLDHGRIHAPFFGELRERINSARSRGGRVLVLDIGAGTGENARLMADAGALVIAAEPAREMRRLGADYYTHPHIRLVDDAMPSLPIVREFVRNNGKFDAVLISASLQYLEPDELKEALRVIAEITKPGGLIRITYPTPVSREHQYDIPPERFKQVLAEVNAALPEPMRLQIVHEEVALASDGRRALSGELLRFIEFSLSTPSRAQSLLGQQDCLGNG
jgi:SAM-dependent methyltransferase